MISRQILFLFSALGAVNGILLAVYFFSRRPFRLANAMLGGLLLAVGVRTAKSTFLFFNPDLAIGFRQLGLSACLLIGPLTYLYVHYQLADLGQRSGGGRWRWHLGLALVLIGLGLVFPYADYRPAWDRSSIGIHAFWFAYLAAAGHALWNARSLLVEPGKRVPMGTQLLLGVYGGSGLILAAYVSTPLTSYIVGALSLTFSLHVAVLVFLLRRETADSEGKKAKYQNRKLADADALALLSVLNDLMTEQKLHLNPNLSLAQLAKKAGCLQAVVSQVLNDRLDKSFKVYVNEFRIAEAKRILIDEPQLNMELVAERCGFNANSTFFSAFKKVTGQTPASYRSGIAIPESGIAV
jgi:AraC-like DNA-binding protein